MKVRKQNVVRVGVRVHVKDGALSVEAAKARVEAFAVKTKPRFLATLSLRPTPDAGEAGGVLAGKTKRTGATGSGKGLATPQRKLKTA